MALDINEVSSHIKTGKKIYQLDSLIGVLKNEAWFAVSQDNLTRRVSVRTLRVFLNGDNDEPSNESYFSSQKVTELMNGANERFDDLDKEIAAIKVRIDDLTNTVNENYTTLDNRITDEVNTLNNRITNEVNDLTNEINRLERKVDKNNTDINNRVTQEVNTLNSTINTLEAKVNKNNTDINNRVTQEVNTLNTRITNLYNELVAADDALRVRCTNLEVRCTNLETRCTNIEQSIEDLDDKLEEWILYGSTPPTNSTLPAGRLYIQFF